MSDVSGVGSSGNLSPQEPITSTTDLDENSALNFFQDSYLNQLAGIASERNLAEG